MRKIPHILLILAFVSFKVQAQDIKKINETTFGELIVEAKNERQSKKKAKKRKSYPEHFDLYFHSKTTTEFDRYGNIIKKAEFNENGDINFIAEYEYLDSINPLKVIFAYPLDIKRNRQVVYTYNQDNKLVQITDSTSNFFEQTEITYPAPFIRHSRLKLNGEYVDKWITESDSLNSYEITTGYDENDSTIMQSKEWYDKNGKLIKLIDFYSSKEPSLIRTYKYNSEGKKIYLKEEQLFDSVVNESYWIRDTINHSVEFKILQDNQLNLSTKTYIDNYGNEIKTEFYDTDNPTTISFILSSEYKYDESNNWIEKKEFDDGVIRSVTHRQIEYFD